MAEAHSLVQTRLGWVGIAWNERGLVRLCPPQPSKEAAVCRLDRTAGGESPPPGDLAERLRRYFEGESVAFNDPVDLSAGTPFQQRVWQALRQIPPGTTLTYGELARRLGKPQAARAVGQALAANPIPIIVPCHRVVAANGRLGGYTGAELSLKAELLRLEAEAAQQVRGA